MIMQDSFGRTIQYLRLSVTDLCNYRCIYCMPEEGVCKKSHADMLSIEEMTEIVRSSHRLGINKDTPDVSDGIIARDDEGNPTGLFREGAMDLMKPLITYTVEQYKQAVLHFQEEYLAHGETLVLDPIVNWDNTVIYVLCGN